MDFTFTGYDELWYAAHLADSVKAVRGKADKGDKNR